MKSKLTYSFLLFFLCSCSSSPDCPKDLNLIPMYGHAQKCAEQIKADKDFIAQCDKIFPVKDSAAKYYRQKGWEFFSKGDYNVAMKRFNESWLLDSNNANVYWGFADILGAEKELDRSITFFNRALTIDTSNEALWKDASVSYLNDFFNKKDKKYFQTGIHCLKKAIEISPDDTMAYRELTIAYSYTISKDSAKKYLAITDKMNATLIPEEVRNVITR